MNEYLLFKEQLKEDFIDKEMQSKRQEALEILKGIISPSLKEKFLGVLSFAWFQENENALTLAEELGLDQEHFITDRKDYYEFYLKKMEYHDEFDI